MSHTTIFEQMMERIRQAENFRNSLEEQLFIHGVSDELSLPVEVTADFLINVLTAMRETFDTWVQPNLSRPYEQMISDFYHDCLGAPSTDVVFKKIPEEVEEVRHARTVGSPLEELREELADIIIATLVTGESLQLRSSEIMREVERKIRVNLDRTWGEVEDGSIHHKD